MSETYAIISIKIIHNIIFGNEKDVSGSNKEQIKKYAKMLIDYMFVSHEKRFRTHDLMKLNHAKIVEVLNCLTTFLQNKIFSNKVDISDSEIMLCILMCNVDMYVKNTKTKEEIDMGFICEYLVKIMNFLDFANNPKVPTQQNGADLSNDISSCVSYIIELYANMEMFNLKINIDEKYVKKILVQIPKNDAKIIENVVNIHMQTLGKNMTDRISIIVDKIEKSEESPLNLHEFMRAENVAMEKGKKSDQYLRDNAIEKNNVHMMEMGQHVYPYIKHNNEKAQPNDLHPYVLHNLYVNLINNNVNYRIPKISKSAEKIWYIDSEKKYRFVKPQGSISVASFLNNLYNSFIKLTVDIKEKMFGNIFPKFSKTDSNNVQTMLNETVGMFDALSNKNLFNQNKIYTIENDSFVKNCILTNDLRNANMYIDELVMNNTKDMLMDKFYEEIGNLHPIIAIRILKILHFDNIKGSKKFESVQEWKDKLYKKNIIITNDIVIMYLELLVNYVNMINNDQKGGKYPVLSFLPNMSRTSNMSNIKSSKELKNLYLKFYEKFNIYNMRNSNALTTLLKTLTFQSPIKQRGGRPVSPIEYIAASAKKILREFIIFLEKNGYILNYSEKKRIAQVIISMRDNCLEMEKEIRIISEYAQMINDDYEKEEKRVSLEEMENAIEKYHKLENKLVKKNEYIADVIKRMTNFLR
jgi:hypothetical protein